MTIKYVSHLQSMLPFEINDFGGFRIIRASINVIGRHSQGRREDRRKTQLPSGRRLLGEHHTALLAIKLTGA